MFFKILFQRQKEIGENDSEDQGFQKGRGKNEYDDDDKRDGESRAGVQHLCRCGAPRRLLRDQILNSAGINRHGFGEFRKDFPVLLLERCNGFVQLQNRGSQQETVADRDRRQPVRGIQSSGVVYRLFRIVGKFVRIQFRQRFCKKQLEFLKVSVRRQRLVDCLVGI